MRQSTHALHLAACRKQDVLQLKDALHRAASEAEELQAASKAASKACQQQKDALHRAASETEERKSALPVQVSVFVLLY